MCARNCTSHKACTHVLVHACMHCKQAAISLRESRDVILKGEGVHIMLFFWPIHTQTDTNSVAH